MKALVKVARPSRLRVCLISPHPGLLADMRRQLSSPRFKLSAIRLKLGPGYDVKQERLPVASVYVVDASSSRPMTESLIETIRGRLPRARFIVLKETLKDPRVFPYLRVGVKGAVRYEDAGRELARAVEVVACGGFWIARPQLVRFVDSLLAGSAGQVPLGEPGYLSRREREVLVAILEGLSNKEIATKLNISERTVKFHVSNLLGKFGAQRRTDLIRKHYQAWPAAS